LSPGSTALLFGDIGKDSVFLAQGSTTPISLGTLPWFTYPVTQGAWVQVPGANVATLLGPTGVTTTVPVDGLILAADDRAVYVDGAALADGSSTLWRYPADGSTPAQIAQGAAVGTAAGNDTLGYGLDSPTLIGEHELVTVWMPVSRTDAAHHALDIQWVALP